MLNISKNSIQGKIDFEITGTQHAPITEQLQNFSFQLTEAMNLKVPMEQPKNWMEAFYMLIQFLKEQIFSCYQKLFVRH